MDPHEDSGADDPLDMRVRKAGHEKIPLVRIERRSRPVLPRQFFRIVKNTFNIGLECGAFIP